MALLLWGLLAGSARAEGINLVTSPLPINLSGKPGSTLTAQLKVKNGAATAIPLKVNLMKFVAAGEEGKPELLDRGPGDEYFDWVSFSPQAFTAQPNQWQTVTMTIHLPQSAAFGYYYAAVFSPANQVSVTKQNRIIGSTAVLVLVDAETAGVKRQLQVVSFTADHRLYQFLPSKLTVKLHNAGNIHVVPFGSIFIKRGKKVVATLDLNKQAGNVLPGTNRIFQSDWSDGFPTYEPVMKGNQPVVDKNGQVERHLTWDFSRSLSKLRFGRYTAELALAYDNGTTDVPLGGSVSFWVIPWSLGLSLLIPLIPIILIIWFYRRRIKRMQLQYQRGHHHV